MKEISAKLWSWSQYPLETLYLTWVQSKDNDEVCTPKELHDRLEGGHPRGLGPKVIRDTISKLFDEGVPVLETISFTFLIENIPISLREQMVRHRIGVKVGPRLGVDIVPELPDSTWWSQSHRVLDMGSFHTDEQYFIPESCRTDPKKLEDYQQAMACAEDMYNSLVESGVPEEDARNVLPMGVTHRTTWTLNLAALKHIVGKRTCWILQRGLWEKLVSDMISELSLKVDPMFKRLATPPCIRGDRWVGCPVKLSNEERITGKDPLVPCPLYLNHYHDEAVQATRIENPHWSWEPNPSTESFNGWVTGDPVQNQQMVEGRSAYGRLWGRDVDTGDILP